MKIKIITQFGLGEQLVDHARRAADDQREALGFLPAAAYEAHAESGKLIVAVDPARETYLGHVLFNGIFPRLTIRQTVVEPSARQLGVGSQLVAHVVREAERDGFLTVKARVADDLTEANAFYEKNGFRLVRQEPGGGARHRLINVRIRELDSPTLFDALKAGPKPGVVSDLQALENRQRSGIPTYVLDLNVLLDAVRGLRPGAKEVVTAGFDARLRLAVTSEFIAELERNTRAGVADPVLEFAKALPRLPRSGARAVAEAVKKLSPIVFPDRPSTQRPQDRSDLIHLANAILQDADGFVTAEKRLLRLRGLMQDRFGVDIVSPDEFAPDTTSEWAAKRIGGRTRLGDETPRISTITSADLGEVRRFLGTAGLSEAMIDRAVPTSCSGILMRMNRGIAGFASWIGGASFLAPILATLVVEEGRPASDVVGEVLLQHMCVDLSSSSPRAIELTIMRGHESAIRTAVSMGFARAERQNPTVSELRKVAVGQVVHSENWPEFRSRLRTLAGLDLAATMPDWQASSDTIDAHADTGAHRITLGQVEGQLSPVLLLTKSRDGVIVPIRHHFAADLLGTSVQPQLAEIPSGPLLRTKVYFCSPRIAGLATPGCPLVFYESGRDGGRKAVVAVSRMVNCRVLDNVDVSSELVHRGVLTQNQISQVSPQAHLAIVEFDNVFHLKTPVSYRNLKRMGCVGPANLVTAQRLSGQQILSIWKESEIERT